MNYYELIPCVNEVNKQRFAKELEWLSSRPSVLLE